MKKDPADIANKSKLKCPRCKKIGWHMWTSPQATEHVSCDACGYAIEVMPQSFVQWWKNHRDSGYAEKGVEYRWNILPPDAWKCHRYRLEFSDATGHPYDPLHYKFQDGQRSEWPFYGAEEKTKWRDDQDRDETMTSELEKIYGKEFWKRMTPLEFIRAVKEQMRQRGVNPSKFGL